MKIIFWVYLAIFLFGLFVLGWPEKDSVMVIRFTDVHGPSKLDLAGLVIIAMGYAPMMLEVWKTKDLVQQRMGSRIWFCVLSLSVLSFSLIALALFIDSTVLLWTFILMSFIFQGVMVVNAFKKMLR